MKTDLATRVLLTAILLCLVLLMVQQRRIAESGEGVVAGRYVVLPVRTGQRAVLIRGDTVTGEMWRAADVPSDAHWVPYGPPSVPEEGEGAASDEAVVTASDESAGLETATGRYEFFAFPFRRGRTILVRHDTTTGEVWGLQRWGRDDALWIDMTEVRPPETEEEVVPEAAAAPAPTPEGEPAPAEGEAAPASESSQGAPGDETSRGSEE